MLSSFWNRLGSKLLDRWFSTAAGALLFWGLGLAGAAWQVGFTAFATRASSAFTDRPMALRAALLVGGLVLVTGSAVVVARIATPITRVIEGYHWPALVSWPLVSWTAFRVRRAGSRYQDAWERAEDPARGAAARRRALDRAMRLELWLRDFPVETDSAVSVRLMPTRLGNTLRAAETRPADKYGLDAVVCWPRLWLTMTDSARKELSAARASLDGAVAAWCWALLFVAWTPWQPLALPLGLAGAWAVYRMWAIPRAAAFGALVEAVFDVQREALYSALRWPMPNDPAAERVAGQELTAYLWRGSHRPDLVLTSRPPVQQGPVSCEGQAPEQPNPPTVAAPAAAAD
jgi:hypothetical protein